MITEPSVASKPGVTTEEAEPAAPETTQLLFTLRADNGEIVNIETIDASGRREDASREACLKIAGEDEIAEIDAALDATFDAAFVDAIEMTDDLEVTGEVSGDDRILERLIVYRLLGRRIGRELDSLRGGLLRRLALRRLARRHVLRTHLEENR